ncbi:hypothetical protein EV198_0329 [Roseivirga ehrenbergii]|uniref:Phage abortive infection protein n=1 Tax=Roseivirga ehrenbergii (strain DSM 102268 / JCM 13514 / KCTC 12282 / NCIMB 14502 / KMM 6017) TaxID=279360 RepID=A0A150X111_ROSEK|nr:hypothetical protein [Roseivirga ehrenbergii]KYG72262.1 hypothetical protein MB14_09485 [Roseivirga ehrenbergii]TCL13504.1 hypothetical protein EV198_0329 [Roseivirga ehrenbergii]
MVSKNTEQLEGEIDKDYVTVASRERQLDKDTSKITFKIKIGTGLAWSFTVVGLFLIVYGILKTGSTDGLLKLNELGDFLSGTLASAWALAGMFFIYVSFLAQTLELKQAKVDTLYARIEMKQSRLEVMKQKEALDYQIDTSKLNQYENLFFSFLELLSRSIQTFSVNQMLGYDSVVKGLNASKIGLSNLHMDFEQRNDIDDLTAYASFKRRVKLNWGDFLPTFLVIIKHLKLRQSDSHREYLLDILRIKIPKNFRILLFYEIALFGKVETKDIIVELDFFKDFIEGDGLLFKEHVRLFDRFK